MSSKSKRVFPNSTVNAFHVDGDVSIVEATYEHAEYLQDHLRSPDVRECMIHGATPWRALRYPILKRRRCNLHCTSQRSASLHVWCCAYL
jgi:hypothetical protein